MIKGRRPCGALPLIDHTAGMASRGHTWFDDEKLLEGEEFVRSGIARVHTAAPPHWWEGELILTSDRLFFLPHVHNPFLPHTAFWLQEIHTAEPAGRGAIHVGTDDLEAIFRIPDTGKTILAGKTASHWLRLIAAFRRAARPRTAFEQETRPRRAAG
jgi:hypothetical protein